MYPAPFQTVPSFYLKAIVPLWLWYDRMCCKDCKAQAKQKKRGEKSWLLQQMKRPMADLNSAIIELPWCCSHTVYKSKTRQYKLYSEGTLRLVSTLVNQVKHAAPESFFFSQVAFYKWKHIYKYQQVKVRKFFMAHK